MMRTMQSFETDFNASGPLGLAAGIGVTTG